MSDKEVLNLDNHSDREISEGLLRLPSIKLFAVVAALAKAQEKAQIRGETIARSISDDLIRRLLGEE